MTRYVRPRSRLAKPVKHPSTRAAKAHSRAGEPLCSACEERAPHGTLAGYTTWSCRCEPCRDAMADYYEADRDTIRAQQSAYEAANPEVWYLRSARRRARKQGVPCTLTADAVLQLIAGTNCPACGVILVRGRKVPRDDSLTHDRDVPELGYVPGNVAVLCLTCNSAKGSSTMAEFLDRMDEAA